MDEIMERARECGQHVAAKRLAEGLACLAFAPGGVKFGALHFEAKHPDAVAG